MISSAFWLGKRVFLIGHTGFKGSWLSVMLARLNARTTGYALEPLSAPSLFDLARIGDHVRDIRGDVRDLARLRAAMNAAEPQIVIHLAARPRERAGQEDSRSTYATNVMGAVNALEAARAVKSVTTALIVASDGRCGNADWAEGRRQTNALGAHDHFSGDAYETLATRGFHDSFFAGGRPMKILCARAGAVIGGGDFATDRVIPQTFRALLAGRTPDVPEPSARPWQHVLEPLLGCLALVETAMTSAPPLESEWDFGPGPQSEQSAETLVARFIDAYVANTPFAFDAEPARDAAQLRPETVKAQQILRWSPLLDFAQTVAWTAKWYRALAEGEDPARITIAQVEAYLGQRVRLVSPFRPQRHEEERHERSRIHG